MHNMDEILQEWGTDSHIDLTALDEESAKVIKIHQKYLKALTDCKKKRRNEQKKLAKLEKLLYEYYRGDINTDKDKLKLLNRDPYQLKILKSLVPKYVEGDSLFQSQKDVVSDLDLKVETLTEIMGAINRLSFTIKNAIEWQKLVGPPLS